MASNKHTFQFLFLVYFIIIIIRENTNEVNVVRLIHPFMTFIILHGPFMQAAVKFCISSRPARFIRPLNRMATLTFTEKKYNNNKDDSFFRLNFNVFLNVDNRERAGARDKKQRDQNVKIL